MSCYFRDQATKAEKVICPRPESYKYNLNLSGSKAEAQMEYVPSNIEFNMYVSGPDYF